MASRTITLTAAIERKQADLPRYVVIPAAAIRAWHLSGTTAVNVTLNGVAVERRTIKYWDDARWFLSITNTDCRRLSIETGNTIELTISLAATDLPSELTALLQTSERARACWESLTLRQQRMLREDILTAKQSATRERRARKALLGL